MIGKGRLIIVEKLTVWSLCWLFLLRVFGFRSIYMDLSERFKSEKFIAFLDFLGLRMNDYSTYRYYEVSERYTRRFELANIAYQEIVRAEDYAEYLKLFGQNDRKTKSAILDILGQCIGVSTLELINSAEYFSKDRGPVYVWMRNNFLSSCFVNNLPFVRRNLNFKFIHLLGLALTLLPHLKGVRLFGRRPSTGKSIEKVENIYDAEVIFFPHMGISYGELFKKDYYYSQNVASPFHPKKLVHVEYGIEPGVQFYTEIKEEYLELGYKHLFYPNLTATDVVKSVFQFLKVPSHRRLAMNRWSAFQLYVTLYVYFSHYQALVSRFSKAKLALVGYDFLCPKPLSLALGYCGIESVSIQERYISGFMDECNVIVDHYFVWGEKVRERLSKHEISYCGAISLVKAPRTKFIEGPNTDVFFHYQKIKEGYSKFVVVFDYHSVTSSIQNRMQNETNWHNNLQFYKDIVKLVVKNPEMCFVIRGKNDLWTRNAFFSDIFELMGSLENVLVDGHYNIGEAVSYQILKLADLVLARHTSIADEAMISKIPVIFHDYGVNFTKEISGIYDYEGYKGFVSSYKELESVFDSMLKGGEGFCLEQYDEIYYSGDNDVEEMLQEILDHCRAEGGEG
jgi:hypothetical protein